MKKYEASGSLSVLKMQAIKEKAMIKKQDYSLLAHNTFGIDVKAATFIEYTSTEELYSIIEKGELTARPFLHIGGGSNLLFLEDFAGTVLHSAIHGIEVMEEKAEEVVVRCGAGVVWDDFVAHCVAREWYGAENLSIIPGEVGAAAIQNIGAYGVEVKDFIVSVEAMDALTGEVRIFSNEECRYAYRNSVFKHELRGKYFITHVVFRLSKRPVFHLSYGEVQRELTARTNGNYTIADVRNLIIELRRSKLPEPKEWGNAGSFFMNPIISIEQYEALKKEYPTLPSYPVNETAVKVPAGWLIEQSGWKGKALGRAGVYERQALVLINLGGATGHDVMALAQQIMADVQAQFGISIHPEVNQITAHGLQ